jgi:hypothetical protein
MEIGRFQIIKSSLFLAFLTVVFILFAPLNLGMLGCSPTGGPLIYGESCSGAIYFFNSINFSIDVVFWFAVATVLLFLNDIRGAGPKKRYLGLTFWVLIIGILLYAILF